MSFQNEHHLVALPDAERLEVISCLVGIFLYISEREASFFHFVGNMYHSGLVGAFSRKSVNDIEAEVESICMEELDACHLAVLACGDFDELVCNRIFDIGEVEISRTGESNGFDMLESVLRLIRTENDSIEFTFLTADSPFVVGFAAVVVDRIALVEDLLIIAYPYFELTADDDIEFLTFMCMRVSDTELLVNVGDSNEERLAYLIAEFRGKTHIAESLSSCDGEAFALACDNVAEDTGRFALHEVGYLNACNVSEFIDKSEAEILSTALICEVFVNGDTGFFGHFFGRETY